MSIQPSNGHTLVQQDSVDRSTCLYGENLYCGWCGRAFLCPIGLKIHFQIEHQSTCYCGRTFDSKHSVLDHVEECGCDLPFPYEWKYFNGTCELLSTRKVLGDDKISPTLVTKTRKCVRQSRCMDCNHFMRVCRCAKNAGSHKLPKKDASKSCTEITFSQSANMDKRALEPAIENADHTRDSSMTKGINETSSKTAQQRADRKDKKPVAEMKFLRSCFSSMPGGLYRCRLCSHVYAQLKTAYLHIHSMHDHQVKKWRRDFGKQSPSADGTRLQLVPDEVKDDDSRYATSTLEKAATSFDVTPNVDDKLSTDSQLSRKNNKPLLTKLCHTCQETFTGISSYMTHLRGRNHCAIVYKYFTDQCEQLADKRAKCRICEKVHCDRSKVYAHIRHKHGIPQILMNSKLLASTVISEAVQTVRGGAITVVSRKKKPKQNSQLFCLFCQRHFKCKSSLRQHKLVCRYRSKQNENKSKIMASAVLPTHSSYSGQRSNKKIYALKKRSSIKHCVHICKYCGREFTQRRNLKRHEANICKLRNMQVGLRKTSLDFENLNVENVAKSTTVELNEGFADVDKLPSASSRATQREPAHEDVLCDETSMVGTVKKTDVKLLDFRGLLRTFGVMCIKCGYTFKSRVIYLRHYAQCRGKCSVKQRAPPEEYHYLANHIESSPGKRFSCTLCNNCTVSRYSDVYKHIRLKHGIPDYVSAGTITRTNEEKCIKSD